MSFRAVILRAALLAAAWVLLACSEDPATARQAPAAGPAEEPAAQRKADAPMIELKVVPVRSEVLSGESLVVQVTLTNAGTEAVVVQSRNEQSAFRYLLRRPEEEDPRYLLSVIDWQTAMWDNPPAPRDMETESAAPGAALVYEEDVAVYASGPLVPGQYRLTAVCDHEGRELRSAEVPVNILRPEIPGGLLATAAGPSEGRLGVAFLHLFADGTGALYQRESDPGNPTTGVLFRRAELPKPGAVTGIACATELDENRGIRWFAWLEDGALKASLAQGNTGFGILGPVDLGVTAPDLAPHGWQTTEEDAVFFAIGAGQGGVPHAVSIALEAGKGGTARQSALGAGGAPAIWAARYHPGSDPATFDVVWVETNGTRSTIHCQPIQPGKKAGGPPVLLAKIEDPLVALALEPVAGAAPGSVDVLYGPVGDENEMVFRRLPLSGGAAVAEWKFKAPVDAAGRPPTAWRIPHAVVPRPIALAILGDEVLACEVTTASDRRTAAGPAPGLDHLRLELIRGTLWGLWTDSEAGLTTSAVAIAEDLGVIGNSGQDGDRRKDE